MPSRSAKKKSSRSGNNCPQPGRAAAGKSRAGGARLLALGLGLGVAAGVSTLGIPQAQAANDAYSTDATSGNFSSSFTLNTTTPTAGGRSSPTSGDSLYFGTATTTTVSNDLTGATFAGFTFLSGASAFTIGGNAFTLTSGITVASANSQIINNNITTSGAEAINLSGGGGLTLGGNLTGNGTITQTGAATGATALTLGGDNSGFTGTFTQANSSSNRTVFNAATAGSASAAWTFNRATGGAVVLNFGTGTINFGSLAGAGFIRNNTLATTDTISVGALNTSTTFSGLLQLNSTANIALTKVGTGTLTLSGANTYTGATTVNGGILQAGVASVAGASGAFGNGSAVTLANTAGVTLDLNNFNTQIGSLAGGGTTGGNVTLGTATLTTGQDNTSTTYAGVISSTSNTGGLTKIGTGTLTLSGVNTYSGATSVQSGLVTLSGAASMANSAVTVGASNGNNTALTITPTAAGTTTRTASLTYGGSFNGGTNTANFNVNGVAAGNTIENFGALTLNPGMMRGLITANAAANVRVVFSGVTRNAGSQLDFDRGTAPGTSAFASQTANTANVVFSTAPTLTGGTGAAGTTTVGVLPWAFVNGVVATYDSTNGLRQLNTSTEMANLATSNTSTTNAKTSGSGTVTLASATSVNSLTEVASVTISLGAGTAGDTTTLTVASGAIAAPGTFTIGAVSGNGQLAFGSAEGNINVSNTRGLQINSVITGSGGLTIGLDDFNNTTATVVLNAANTYTGVTRVTGNNTSMVVRLLNSLALQNTTLDYNNYGASVQFGTAATTSSSTVPFTLSNVDLTTVTFGGLTGAQNLALTNSGSAGGGVTLTIGSVGSADTASTINTYSGVLSGAGSLIKAGVATEVLSGLNTFTGTTSINGGTLSVTNIATGAAAQALGENAGLNLGGGTLQYTGAAATLDKNITVGSGGGTISNTGGQLLTISGTINNGGALNLSGGKFVVSGAISGASANTGLNVIGASTVGETVANTYTGPTSISGGSTLLTGIAGALPTGTPSALTLGAVSDGAVTNTLDLLGTAQTVASLSTLGSATNQVVSSNGSATTPAIGNAASATAGTLTVNYNGGTTDTFGGSLGGAGALTNFGLIKTGTGTLALTGSNTYTGGTSIFGGTLSVGADGNLGASTGGIAINNGAQLQTTATLTTNRNISLGNILPGGTGAPGTSAPTGLPTALINVGAGTTLTLQGVITGDANSELELLSGAAGRTSGGNGLIVLNNNAGSNNFGSLYLHGTSIAGNNLLVKTGAGPQFGNAPVTQDGGSTLISDQNGTFSAQFSIGTGGAVRETDSSHTVFRTGAVVNVSTQNGGLTFQGDETASGSAGTLGLGGTNTFTGAVVVNGNGTSPGTGVNTAANVATLSISADANLGNANNTLTLNNAALQTGDGINTTGTTNTAVKGDVSLASTRNVYLSGTATFNVLNTHNAQLNATAAGTSPTNSSLFIAAGLSTAHTNTLTVNGVIADGTSPGTLNKNGLGNMVLTATNSYTGGTMINGGVLSVSADANLGDTTTGAGISINNGATLNATGTFTTNRNINLGTLLPGTQGNFVAFTSTAADAAATGPSAPINGVTGIISANGGATLTLQGQILGDSNSQLELADGGGTGNAYINLANTNGPTYPNPGNVGNRFGTIYLHGTSTSAAINNGAAVNNLVVTVASVPQFANAAVIQDGGATLISNQNGTFSSSFKIGTGGAVRETGAGDTVFRTGTISNVTDVTNAGGLTFQGDETNSFSAGTLGLGGTNTFGGNTGDANTYAVTVNGATLSISNDANLGKSGNVLNLNSATLAIEDGINNDGTNNNVVQANVTTSRSINLTGTDTFFVSNTHNAQLNSFNFSSLGTHTNTLTVNGVIADGASAGSLTKTGPGIMIVAGANTYSGGTTVNAGTLLVNNTSGSGTGGGGVTVNNSGTLGGSGYISSGMNNVAITNGGTLAPSGSATNSFNTLHVATTSGALTLSSNATYAYNIDGSNHDLVSLSGGSGNNLSIDPNALLALRATGSNGINYSATYALFTGVTGLNGGFTPNNVSGYDSTDYSPALMLNGSEYDLSFNPITPVPEPSTWAAGILALGALGYSQRRRLAASAQRWQVARRQIAA